MALAMVLFVVNWLSVALKKKSQLYAGMGEGEYADEPSDELVDKVFAKMWEFNNAYTVSNSVRNLILSQVNRCPNGCCCILSLRQSIPVWYVMDEFGSRIQHSDNPSVAMSVFFYIHLQVAFSVIWPLRDLDCEGALVYLRLYAHMRMHGVMCCVLMCMCVYRVCLGVCVYLCVWIVCLCTVYLCLFSHGCVYVVVMLHVCVCVCVCV